LEHFSLALVYQGIFSFWMKAIYFGKCSLSTFKSRFWAKECRAFFYSFFFCFLLCLSLVWVLHRCLPIRWQIFRKGVVEKLYLTLDKINLLVNQFWWFDWVYLLIFVEYLLPVSPSFSLIVFYHNLPSAFSKMKFTKFSSPHHNRH